MSPSLFFLFLSLYVLEVWSAGLPVLVVVRVHLSGFGEARATVHLEGTV